MDAPLEHVFGSAAITVLAGVQPTRSRRQHGALGAGLMPPESIERYG
jgi:hypothetical protein